MATYTTVTRNMAWGDWVFTYPAQASVGERVYIKGVFNMDDGETDQYVGVFIVANGDDVSSSIGQSKDTSIATLTAYYTITDDITELYTSFDRSTISKTYLYSGNQAYRFNCTIANSPTAPATLTVPTTIVAGETTTISWSTATDADGNLSGYTLQRKLNSGSWTQVYKGSSRTYGDIVPSGTETVQYRVCAYDTGSLSSSYTTSDTITVTNNTASVITCTSSDLGTLTDAFAVDWSVTDVDADTVTATVKLDGVTIATYTDITLDTTITTTMTATAWQQVLNGSHTLQIIANDGTVDSSHAIAFAKSVTDCAITMTAPMCVEGDITVAILAVNGSVPADAIMLVEVTNNANDDTPTWQDATADVLAGANIVFDNAVCANGAAFNFRVSATVGDSGAGGYITSVSGAFQ